MVESLILFFPGNYENFTVFTAETIVLISAATSLKHNCRILRIATRRDARRDLRRGTTAKWPRRNHCCRITQVDTIKL